MALGDIQSLGNGSGGHPEPGEWLWGTSRAWGMALGDIQSLGNGSGGIQSLGNGSGGNPEPGEWLWGESRAWGMALGDIQGLGNEPSRAELLPHPAWSRVGNASLQWGFAFLKSLFLQGISNVLCPSCGCPVPGSITGGAFRLWEKRKPTVRGLFALQGVESVKKEIDESVLGQTGPYRRPERLRKRTEYSGERIKEQRVFEANEEAMGMVLHKDSKWYQQWKDFKDNNVVFNRFFEMKMKYDESDNAFIRASRAVTDRVTDLLGGLFSKTEMSEVLTEILRVDPSFDKDRFLKQCERDIIPNVLEALISGELDILKDWCYEATYSQLAHPIQQAKALGLQFHSRILDIDNIDLAMGKMMEQGPVLIITFQAQVVMVIKNHKGEVVEGDPDKVLRMLYVWALCRDQDELNPYMAWRLLDISSSSTEQVL
uniref:Mitochondrial import inner membrane translocase subunit TIM44 n=1 Tax=Cyanistes caeruleus TaxID=156563 RepID=A0A8C0U894_CYACU